MSESYQDMKPLTVAITGSSGLVGSALVTSLRDSGHRVLRIVRQATLDDTEIAIWDPYSGTLDLDSLSNVDAVINLAGENISSTRWSVAKKKHILQSRLMSTRTVVDAILKMEKPPKVFLNASAIGYYGEEGTKEVYEDAAPGQGFLAEVCQHWEEATRPLMGKGTRLAYMRFGMILASQGGALQQMLTPFKWGLGGTLGSGQQYYSWITLEDAIQAIHHILATPSLYGPINMVTPEPVTNKTFTKALGSALRRPAILPIPALVARLAFGEIANALLLCSCRALPSALLASGYRFRWPTLAPALQMLLG